MWRRQAIVTDATPRSSIGTRPPVMYNSYGSPLSASQIAKGAHRAAVGGLWEELGDLQLSFMVRHGGLTPEMKLLDLGCGCLRGGVRFIAFLEPGNYYGLDLNASLVDAGWEVEIPAHGLEGRLDRDHLLVADDFGARRFGVQFDRVLAVSLWTHMPLGPLRQSLEAVATVLKPDGFFFATAFLSDPATWSQPCDRSDGIVTHHDRDPYHHRWADVLGACASAGLAAELIGDWGHPRGQQMIRIAAPSRRDRLSDALPLNG